MHHTITDSPRTSLKHCKSLFFLTFFFPPECTTEFPQHSAMKQLKCRRRENNAFSVRPEKVNTEPGPFVCCLDVAREDHAPAFEMVNVSKLNMTANHI